VTEIDPDENYDILDPPVRVIFSGRVQGVGFRWTCQRIAKRHPVSGTVKNLADGTVELFADGNQQSVIAFLVEINSKMSGNIREQNITPVRDQVTFEGFKII
jgi:acylphosphatase